MKDQKKKILVTGGAGYIGSHTIVELIEAGYEPIIVDNFSNSDPEVIGHLTELCGTPISSYEINCDDKEKLRDVFVNEEEIYGVIHFAAFKAVEDSVHHPLKYYRNNIGSLVTLLELMDQFNVRNLVFSSSCSVYGDTGTEAVRENSEMASPKSPYGFTKQVCEQIIQDAVGCGQKINAVALRYFNPIGAHPSGVIGELPINKPSNLVPFITQTAAGILKELTVFGGDYNTADGTAVRDFIHVTDLANAHVRSLDWLGTVEQDSLMEVFNIGSGSGYTVKEVIDTFQKVNKLSLNYKIGDRREGDVEQIFASIQKANNTLNWTPKKSLGEALKDAWNWQLSLSEVPYFNSVA